MTDRSLGKARETLRRAAEGPPNDSCRLLPKIEPIRGSLQTDWKKCGKPTCGCSTGEPHGPYWSLRWREDGRQRRRYIKWVDLEQVQAGLAEWRRLHPPARSAREGLAEWRRLHPPARSAREALALLRRLTRDLDDWRA